MRQNPKNTAEDKHLILSNITVRYLIRHETLCFITFEIQTIVKIRVIRTDRLRKTNIVTKMLVLEYLVLKYELVQVEICKGEEVNTPYYFSTIQISRNVEIIQLIEDNRL